jgi:hypothetical protein
MGTLSVDHHPSILVAVGESHEEALHLHHGRGGQHMLCLCWTLLVARGYCSNKYHMHYFSQSYMPLALTTVITATKQKHNTYSKCQGKDKDNT